MDDDLTGGADAPFGGNRHVYRQLVSVPMPWTLRDPQCGPMCQRYVGRLDLTRYRQQRRPRPFDPARHAGVGDTDAGADRSELIAAQHAFDIVRRVAGREELSAADDARLIVEALSDAFHTASVRVARTPQDAESGRAVDNPRRKGSWKAQSTPQTADSTNLARGSSRPP